MLKKLSNKIFPIQETAYEASNYVINEISHNGYSRLRKYRGKSSKAAFTRSIVKNLLNDFHRSRYGRRRPPGWIKVAGAQWIKIFNLICLERRHDEEVLIMLSNPGTGKAMDPEEVRWALREIRTRIPDCGGYRPSDSLEQAIALEDEIHAEVPQDWQDDDQQHSNMSALLALVNAVPTTDSGDAMVKDLRALNLTNEDKVILRSIYVDGSDVAKVSRALKKTDAKVRYKLKKLLSAIQAVLISHGVGIDDFDIFMDSS